LDWAEYNSGSNHDYNKILESDWLSSAMIWVLIRQCNWTVYTSCLSNWTLRIRARALMDHLHVTWISSFSHILQLKLLSTPSPEHFLLILSWILLWIWLIGNRTSCHPIQSVIILGLRLGPITIINWASKFYEHNYSWIVREEVQLLINHIYNKMRD